MEKNKQTLQHQPLRPPVGWKEQDRALVIQIDRLFDDVYRMIGQIREQIKELQEEDA